MRFIVLINFLMMLIHTTGLTETATTNNLLPNAGTGQTSVQHSNSTIDGINSSSNWTLNKVSRSACDLIIFMQNGRVGRRSCAGFDF